MSARRTCIIRCFHSGGGDGAVVCPDWDRYSLLFFFFFLWRLDDFATFDGRWRVFRRSVVFGLGVRW